MGMDVYGKNATSETGEYFRNNVWYWRPLWNYCEEVAPHLCADVSGQFNDGDGLDAEGADQLAHILFSMLADGHTQAYEQAYNKRIAELPRRECSLCEGTGIRTDQVGQDMGMPTRELDEHVKVLTGRSHGWCNACGGEGLRDHHDADYPFTVENVRAFAEFLSDCGGFEIC